MAHTHGVYDTDIHFLIDPITREIKNKSAKVTLIQYDHDSERFTFEIPRMVDGHDMSLCNKVQVHFINVENVTKNKHSDIYEVDDLQVSTEDENTLTFSWLISENATQYAGNLNFAIRFLCITEDGAINYAWSTAIFSGLAISAGIYNSDVIYEENFDILEQWKNNLLGNTLRISEVELLSSAWVGDNSLYSQVVTIDGVTANSQVDLTPSVEQLSIFYEKDLTFVTKNIGGVVTVYAIGQKPQNDYTIQVTITEVAYG